MCKHKRVIYIGEQKSVGNKTIPMFNCLDCLTTISRKSLPLFAKIQHDLQDVESEKV